MKSSGRNISKTLAISSQYRGYSTSKPKGPLLPLYARPHQVFTHGQGCYLIDSNGKKFLDFTSGIAVNALGHNHPKVVEIVADQASKLIHLSNLYHNEYAQGLAQMIVDSLGENDTKLSGGAQVFFANTGTEANEGTFWT